VLQNQTKNDILMAQEQLARQNIQTRQSKNNPMKSLRETAKTITAKQWALVSASWVGMAILTSSQLVTFYGPKFPASTWYDWLWRFLPDVAYAALWIISFPLVLWVSRRFPLEEFKWRYAAVHLVFGTAIVLTTMFCRVTVMSAVWAEKNTVSQIIRLMYSIADNGTLSYLFSLVLCFTITYYGNYRERELAASQLETQLVQAQLQALKSQLHPHFLFNALNTIAMLIRTKKEESAIDMVAGLSDYLRTTLSSYDAQLVPLRQEISLLTLYLDIQRVRFQDRLSVEWDIDPALLDSMVPGLILQPLVENAIQHGIAKASAAGRLTIRAAKEDGMLAVRITDDGPGLGPDWRANPGSGIGLKNTKARLEKLYPSGYRLELRNNPKAGATLFMAIPEGASKGPQLPEGRS
jgi:two-component system, LytTR family, sensor kinase